jgi:uncharacterized protein VirK/YbjX
MLFRYLLRYWYLSSRSYSLPAWGLSAVRSLRVLRWPGQHRDLCRLDIYRRYLAGDGHADVFHHLSHRDYLSRHLAPSERVACVLDHYRFEDNAFTQDYKDKVYRRPGLCLWRHVGGDREIAIWLRTSQRYLGEGDLNLVLCLGEEPLHRIGFSWVSGGIAGLPAVITPLIARNQGRWQDDQTAPLLAAFEAIFPHNSPAYFCAAAMQGLALAIGAPQLLCVRSELALSFDPAVGRGYPGAYDSFWDAFEGTHTTAHCHVIPVPFQFKDIKALASKRRKRALARRVWWSAIGNATCTTLRQQLARPAASVLGMTPITAHLPEAH